MSHQALPGRGVASAREPGSEAIALRSHTQSQSALLAHGLPQESAIGDLNNARATLSMLHELLAADEKLDDASVYDDMVVSAARRIAWAVNKLVVTPVAVRLCRNCFAPLVGDVTLRCVYCSQVERGNEILVAGAELLDESQLGRGALDEESTDVVETEPEDAERLIADMRERYHAASESAGTLEGDVP